MNKIKYIHCFGTSYTAGGGFEFDSPGRKDELMSIYGNLKNEEFTQFNFSWPGQLQKLFKENKQKINVYNHAKQGYGNELMYRKTFEIINEESNLDEHLFLLEFSGIGRKEFYCNDINDYIITNYYLDESGYKFDGAANSYWYDTKTKVNKIKPTVDLIKELFPKVLNEKDLISQIIRNNSFFISFLILNNINFLFTQPPPLFPLKRELFEELVKLKTIKFKSYDEELHDGFVNYFHHEGLQIFNETNGIIKWDGHASLLGNKQISIQIYNKLIQENYLTGYYKKFLPSNFNIFEN